MLKFSVLMPIYIKENPQYLSRALDSILISQTIKPTEVIIVEDGPLTSVLYETLENYQSLFPDVIKIFKLKNNMGMGFAMNHGLNKCNYDWIFRMDSDDIASSMRFEKQLAIIKTNKYDVIGSSIQEFNHEVGDLKRFRVMPEEHKKIIRMMKTRNPINHMTVAYRKTMALKAGGYWDRRYFEDYNLWYEMHKIGARFYNIKESLVYARIGNNMVARRSGLAYYKFERTLMKKFLNDSFITKFEYIRTLAFKFLLRNLPVSLLDFVYKSLLRKRRV